MAEVSVISQREVLLVPFPFSDFSARKVRPVLVLSNDRYNRVSDDVIVCAITSNMKQTPYAVEISPASMESGDLNDRCMVKVENILMIAKKIIIKRIGTVNQKTFSRTRKALNRLF